MVFFWARCPLARAETVVPDVRRRRGVRHPALFVGYIHSVSSVHDHVGTCTMSQDILSLPAPLPSPCLAIGHGSVLADMLVESACRLILSTDWLDVLADMLVELACRRIILSTDRRQSCCGRDELVCRRILHYPWNYSTPYTLAGACAVPLTRGAMFRDAMVRHIIVSRLPIFVGSERRASMSIHSSYYESLSNVLTTLEICIQFHILIY